MNCGVHIYRGGVIYLRRGEVNSPHPQEDESVKWPPMRIFEEEGLNQVLELRKSRLWSAEYSFILYCEFAASV